MVPLPLTCGLHTAQPVVNSHHTLVSNPRRMLQYTLQGAHFTTTTFHPIQSPHISHIIPHSTPSLKLSQSYYVSYYNAAVCMMLYLANTKTAKHCIINYNASDWDALSRHQCIDIMFKRSLCFHLPQSRAVMQWRFCRQEPVHLSGSASGHSGVSIPSL